MSQNMAIELKNVSKIFETEEIETHALKEINLNIEKGSYVSISGPSGCGKSTLLSLLGLLDMPTSGEYLIEGKNVSKLSMEAAADTRNTEIGFIFQSFNLIDELSVFDNVALPLTFGHAKLTQEEITRNVTQSLELVGLKHRLTHKPNQLSGGQQQRVAIARAIVTNPTILLVDEPTGNLDSESGEQVMNLLSELNRAGTTICLVTHDPRYADMAKTRYGLYDGELSLLEADELIATY